MKKILFTMLFLVLASNAYAVVLFSDNFDLGASAVWGNEVGSWSASGGVYDSAFPNNSPLTYSSVTSLPSLTDFAVDFDVNNLSDGGIFLRSSDNNNGVLLVTGGKGKSFDGMYWHVITGGSLTGILSEAALAGLQHSNSHVRVEVVGNTYKAFVNGDVSPLTTLVDSTYSSGKVALYDFSSQTFDNVVISDFENPGTQGGIPEPATLSLIMLSTIGYAAKRRFVRS